MLKFLLDVDSVDYYNQPFDKFVEGLGYDLGDYSFEEKESYAITQRMACQVWLESQKK